MDPLSRTLTASMGSGTPAWLMGRPSLCGLLSTLRVPSFLCCATPSCRAPVVPWRGQRWRVRVVAVLARAEVSGLVDPVPAADPGHHHQPDQRAPILVLVEGRVHHVAGPLR